MTREMTLFALHSGNKWKETITWAVSKLSVGEEHKQTCSLPTRAPRELARAS